MQVCPSHTNTSQPQQWLHLGQLASSASMLRQLTIPSCSHELVEQSSHLSLGRHCCWSPVDSAIKNKQLKELLSVFVRLIDYLFVQASPLTAFLNFVDEPVSVLHQGSDDRACCLKVPFREGYWCKIDQSQRLRTSGLANHSGLSRTMYRCPELSLSGSSCTSMSSTGSSSNQLYQVSVKDGNCL